MTQDAATPASDRRRFQRVEFFHAIDLKSELSGKVYAGAFNDISLKGMLFHAEELPPRGDVLTGIMTLGESQMRLHGTVVFCSERGAALRFDEMDVESFSHLRALVAHNSGDAASIDQEFFDALDREFSGTP
ncbi:MAG: PilZ domain-containing protein [Magnetococcus sp. WYHC-3]